MTREEGEGEKQEKGQAKEHKQKTHGQGQWSGLTVGVWGQGGGEQQGKKWDNCN